MYSDSPTMTDAISDCLNVDRVRKRFVVTNFFCLLQLCTVDDSLVVFFGLTTVNIFSSVVLTSLDEHFQQLFRMAAFCISLH